MIESSGSYIVAWDFSKEDTGVLIVGSQKNNKMSIVNAFQGEEARELYEKLSARRNQNDT